jgi:hypothetical protein
MEEGAGIPSYLTQFSMVRVVTPIALATSSLERGMQGILVVILKKGSFDVLYSPACFTRLGSDVASEKLAIENVVFHKAFFVQ